MIALAVEYRQAEKNTPPDFSTNPPANRNSVFCQKAPKHAELNGLVQAQDPANDPNLFFNKSSNCFRERRYVNATGLCFCCSASFACSV